MEEDPAAKLFGTEDFDLYATLGLDKTASADQIKSAYRKLALKCHPDKQANASESEKAAAATKFQQVGYSYSILSEVTRRKRYDDTGRTDNPIFPDDASAWQAYFEELWTGQVNATTIDEFFDKYEGSEEEKADVIEAYKESDGDIEHLLAHCMTRHAPSAESHLEAIVNKAIKDGDLVTTSKWKKSVKNEKAKAKRAKIASLEANEAEEMAKELGVHDKLYGQPASKGSKGKNGGDNDGEEALKALMQQRGAQTMQASLAALEAKYGAEAQNGSKGKGKKRKSASHGEENKEQGEISDAEFAALQAKMFGGSKDKGAAADSSASKKRKGR